MEPLHFGARIRLIRRKRGLTQRQLAQQVGSYLDERDIARVESGRRGVLHPHLLCPILRALGTDPDSFINSGGAAAVPAPLDSIAGRVLGNTCKPASQFTSSELQLALTRLREVRASSEIACLQASQLLDRSQQLVAARK